MTITRNWRVASIETVDISPEVPDYVQTVHWTLDTTDGVNTDHCYGSVSFPYDPAIPFTPFETLRPAEVLRWVRGAIGTEEVARIRTSAVDRLNGISKRPRMRQLVLTDTV